MTLLILSRLSSFTPFHQQLSPSIEEYYKHYQAITSSKDWNRGEKLFRQAIEEYPGELNFHCYLNEMLRNLGKKEEALNQISPIFEVNQKHEYVFGCYKWSLIEYGLELRENKKLSEALSVLDKAFSLDKNDITATLWYGILLRENGDFKGSIAILEEGEKKFDNNYITDNLIYSLVEQANLLWKENPAEAESMYLKALEINETNLTPLLWYGIFLNDQKRYQEALDILIRAQKLYPDSEYLSGNINHSYLQLGLRFDEQGEPEEALKIYEQAIRSFPEMLHYYYYSFVGYLKLNRLDEAEACLGDWCRMKAQSSLTGDELFSEENNIRYRLNDLVKKFIVDKDFARALALYNELEPYFTHRYLILNGRGELLWFNGEKEEGIATINKAYDEYMKNHPENINPVFINPPVKGTYIVACGNNSTTTMTHAGFARFCFDFMGSDAIGRTMPPEAEDLGGNTDYFGFGMPIYSPVDGVVVSVYDDGIDHPPTTEWSYHLEGNHITIQDENSYNYVFVHNKHKSALVRKGDKVVAGQQIASIGNTASSVPHLHFGVWSKDWTVSIPIRFIRYTEVTGDDGSNRILRLNSTPEQGTVIFVEW